MIRGYDKRLTEAMNLSDNIFTKFSGFVIKTDESQLAISLNCHFITINMNIGI